MLVETLIGFLQTQQHSEASTCESLQQS